MNIYAGPCQVCAKRVKVGQGFAILVDDEWFVVHEECSDEPAPAVRTDVPAGHYAVDSTGTNDLDFFRVEWPDSDHIRVRKVIGGHPDQPVRRDQVSRVLDRIATAGIKQAQLLYGRELGQCWNCNRHLTDALSRALGIGPECRRVIWSQT